MHDSSQRPAGRLRWIAPAAVFAFFLATATATTASVYDPVDLLAIGALYALLAIALVAGARLAGRLVRGGAIVSATLVGVTLAWHLREQTRTEGVGPTLWTVEGMVGFGALAAAMAVTYGILELAAARRSTPPPARRLAISWLAASVGFVALLGLVFHGTSTMRWHLVRHNRLLGTPAFHLFATPVAEIEGADWERHAASSTPAPTAIAATSLGAADRGPAAASRPDIVFVLIDTLRADGLAAYGGDPESMPSLNHHAADAMVFRDVRANASWTQPSVASFFTGLTPEEHGAVALGFGLSPHAVTLAEVLQAEGYETAAFIANHRIIAPSGGFGRGFDVFEPLADPRYRYARADFVNDRVVGWLGSRPPDAPPLFLYVHYFDPHIPYLSSEGESSASPTSHAEARRLYDDELRFLDLHLDAFLGELEARLRRPRWTLITSDHGEEFGEHDGRGHSQTLYREVLDIPAVVSYTGSREVLPGVAPDSQAAQPAGIVDEALEGRDFFDLLARIGAGGDVDARDWAKGAARATRLASVSFRKPPGQSALVHYVLRPYRHQIYARLIEHDGWRLIWSAFGPTFELYDRASDPLELRNLASREPALVRALSDRLRETPRVWAELFPTTVPEEALDDLRALGYIR